MAANNVHGGIERFLLQERMVFLGGRVGDVIIAKSGLKEMQILRIAFFKCQSEVMPLSVIKKSVSRKIHGDTLLKGSSNERSLRQWNWNVSNRTLIKRETER